MPDTVFVPRLFDDEPSLQLKLDSTQPAGNEVSCTEYVPGVTVVGPD